MIRTVALCLFFSGAGSLVLEVVWSRLLRLVFGSTTLAVSTVLVAYMLGLGLGGFLGGRFASRLRNGVRAYGIMEIAIGLYAAAVPWILERLPIFTREILADMSFWPSALCRFAVVLGILLLPTLLMGATLPVLVAALVRGRSKLASSVGLLYGVNTLGAVTGVLVATFYLFGTVGVTAANLVGASLDVLVGSVAIALLAPRFARPEAAGVARPYPGREPAPVDELRRWNPALLAYGTVGFTALVYEVCWTRALAMVLGSSIYAFATMLASFLTGIALGSLIGRRWFDALRRPLVVYAAGLAMLGVLSLATLLAFRALPDAFISLIALFGASRTSLVLTGVLVSMSAMLAPTLVLGALFPLLTRALAAGDHSRTVGDVYFVNTLGSAAGAFMAGFVLIPVLGLRHTMALSMAINFLAAGAVLLWQRQWVGNGRTASVALAAAAAVALLVWPPAWDQAGMVRGVYRFPGDLLDVGIVLEELVGVPQSEMVYYREGINTTVSVHKSSGEIHLRVNGKADASSGGDAGTQTLIGQIPMLFGPPKAAENVLIIGLASGMTVGSVATHEPERIDVIELEPAMVEASHFFDEVNGRPLEKPFVHVIADDGRNFMANTREPYDVIISEPSNPWITGASSLFTREYFHLVHDALAPGGRFAQWIQLYGLDAVGLRSIVAALRAEFPYVYGFINSSNESDFIVLAADEPLSLAQLPRWENLPEPVRDDLRRVGNFSTADLWSLLRLGTHDTNAIAAEASVMNTDDNMYVELESPWKLYDVDAVPENHELVRRFLGGPLSLLEENGKPVDGKTVGELAFSYAGPRADAEMARELARLARERGETAYPELAEVRLEIAANQPASEEDLARLRKAWESRPDSVEANYMLAQALNDNGQSEEAYARVEEALRLAPGDLRARLVRLEILLSLGRSAEARSEAVALLRSPVRQNQNLGSYAAAAAADSGNVQDGIREMKAALGRLPGLSLYWVVLAQMYTLAGDDQNARLATINAERAERNLVLGLHQKALRDERLFSGDRAVESLLMALALDPDYEPAKRDLERLGFETTEGK